MRLRDCKHEHMTAEQIIDVISRIEYKPDWRIETYRDTTYGGHAFDSVLLRIKFKALDSVRKVEEADVVIALDIKSYMFREPKDVVWFVKNAITEAEMHERDEWLRFDGVLVDDPHASDPVAVVSVDVTPLPNGFLDQTSA